MVQINFARKEVSCKLVYYGPGMSGKTTNLQIIHQKAPHGAKGDLVAIATEGDRTLFFDFLPLDLGKVKGMNTKFQLYTVPGQVYYATTRKLVLQGADGVVFVADSQRKKLEDNLESLRDLEGALKAYGIDIREFPVIIQWNKRDLPDAAEIPWLEEKINWLKAPTTEAVAAQGEGVMSTLKAIARMVLDRLNEKGSEISAGSAPPVTVPAKKEEEIVAQVNGDKVTKSSFINYCQIQYRLTATGNVEDFKKLEKKEYADRLHDLINYVLLMKEAKQLGITVDRKQLEAQVAQIVRKFGSKEKFQLWMDTHLLSMDNIKNEAVKSLIVGAMLKQRDPNLAGSLEPSAEEVMGYFDSHRSAFPGRREEYEERIRQILKNKKRKKLLDGLYSELRGKSRITVFEDKL